MIELLLQVMLATRRTNDKLTAPLYALSQRLICSCIAGMESQYDIWLRHRLKIYDASRLKSEIAPA